MTSAKLIEPRAPRRSSTPRWWWIAAFLASGIALYSLRYVVLGERAYVPDLADSFRARPWGIAIHALFGPVALTLGLAQFLPQTRQPGRWRIHRVTGRIYGVSAVMLAIAGLYMSAYSAGGMITHTGFGLLALGVLGTTFQGYRTIRNGDVVRHREWMLRSYVLIFGAVTLRLLLPFLIVAYQGQFLPAYKWVAWASWVPNMLWAEWLIHRGWRPAYRLDTSEWKKRDLRGARTID